MRITRRHLRRIIAEEMSVITKDAIEDVVMDVLSDEGGAAGLDPIEDELEELEDDDTSLPDESIEDLIDDVPGVKRHRDGDYVDTTQLESRKIRVTKSQLMQIIREAKKDQNKDGDHDFDDVKIAKMKASGMSDSEIKKKYPELFNERKDSSGHPTQYGAPEGSTRDKQLDQTQADFKKAKELRKKGKAKQAKELEQRAYKRRDRMEKKERAKNESLIRALIEAMLDEDDLNEDDLDEELSTKTKKSLDKKADKRGLTRGSVYKEFEKGLAAFATSGSRKGMSAHQWAHARVNSANPSKKWAVVKKSKAKKK